ncbi:MAG TPA: hypothetical protein VD903_10170 [Pseudonocardia sp.]|nr:hypothetical protein [Pseudonocardia sp.]
MNESADRADGPPPAADRPFVDGRERSSEELRREVAELDEEHRARVDEMRQEVGGTVEELASRLDVRARVAAGRDEAVAAVREQAGRVRPTVVATLGAALAVLLLVLRRRRRTSG